MSEASGESDRAADGSPPIDGSRGRAHSGRRPGSADTRGQILDAARVAFGERGFDGATIRVIATRAGVDPALVHHFYGSKQQLFMAAMEFPIDFPAVMAMAMAGPPERIGENVVRAVLGAWESPTTAPLILGVVRSATTDPVAAGMLQQFLTSGPLNQIGGAIGLPDGQLRAILAGSHLIGLAMARYVIKIEPLASADIETLVRIVGPTIQRYLTGEIAAD
jgi:AcrR family transcriptional regulator